MSGTVVNNARAPENHGQTDTPVFREWVPLHHLIEKIPPRFHQGFVSKDLVLTCVTVSCDSVVLGSNAGVLFWFNRSNHNVNRRNVDDKFIPITALAITVCHYGEVLAVGNLQGTVAMFLASAAQSTPITTFNGEHMSSVTALSWDGSGVHLLSGDEGGKVFLSKFEHNTIRPIKQILLETSSIVQVRFHPLENNLVLVSSLKRALVADIGQPETVVSQVGQQDRKNPAPFGADFGYAGNEAVIYSSRPGLRLWLSNCQGSVRQTLIFKESLSKPRSKLILLSVREEYSNGEFHFGPVYCLSNGLVLTYSPSSLFLLDTGQMGDEKLGQVSVFCSSRFNPKSLRHAMVFHNEIFFLFENRVLIRVSDRPDQSLTVPSATIDRPLLSGWRDKLPVKPTFQSTISKLANKISDVEIKPLPVTNTGPYFIESLSNALAPLFEMKTLPINRCAPPKPIQPQFSSRTRTPSPSSSLVGERCSPISHDKTQGNSRVESTASQQLGGSPISSLSSGQASPSTEGSLCPGDEELVYGSYIGRKRKLKLNRKLNAHDEAATPFSEQSHTSNGNMTENGQVEPCWLDNVTKAEDFLEELKRKDELLAQLLQLDQPSDSPIDQNPTEEETTGRGGESEQHLIDPVDQAPSPVSQDTTFVDQDVERQNQHHDNIYSIYASEEEGLDKSIPYSSSTPTITESTPNQTVLSSGDYENITQDELSEWVICPLDSKRKVTSVAASRHYIVIVYGNKSLYYQSTESTFQARDWLPIATPASQIAVSTSGQQLWRLYKGTAYQGFIVNPHCPVAQHWNALDSYIASIGIVQLDATDAMEDFIWMLHTNGSLSCRSVKSPKKMFLVDAPATVAQLCCYNDLVLILLTNGALYSRSRVTFETPMGVAWQRQEAPGELITVALSPSRHLWVLNRSEQMFFRTTNDKRWWQVSVLPMEFHLKNANWLNVSSFFKRQSSRFELAVTDSRICLALVGTSVLMTAQNLSGYAWDKIIWCDSSFNNNVEYLRIMNASGYNDEDKAGIVWLVDDKKRLLCYYNEQLEQMSLPTDSPIQQLSVKDNHLWLLTTMGKIYVRVANSNPIGSGWVQLSTAQFQSSNRLCFVSLGSELAWACDQYGHIYFRSGDNGLPTLLAPAWIAVDEKNIFFKEIHVSPILTVWALDIDGKIYLRQGVTQEMPIGTGWDLVGGLQAIQLAVSENGVWALSNAGSIYRRTGITQQNWSGNTWEKIPGSFTFISVTVDDKLWVLDSNGDAHQLLTSFPLKNGVSRHQDEILHLDEDWVLL